MKRLSLFVVICAVGCQLSVDKPTVVKPGETANATSTASNATTSTTGGKGASSGTSGTTGSDSKTTGSASTSGTTGTDSKTTGSASSTTGKTDSTKTTATTSGSTGTTAGTASTTDTPASPPSEPVENTAELKKKPGYIPSRLYQLSMYKTVTLGVNGHKLATWVADTENKGQEGLMFVKDKDITPDQAMIFVYSAPKEQGFWMKNTYISLDIAYVGADKKVVSTATMTPFDEKNVPSKGMAQYAVEMKVGSLARLGITKGTQFDIPDTVKSLDQAPPGPPPGMGGMGGPNG